MKRGKTKKKSNSNKKKNVFVVIIILLVMGGAFFFSLKSGNTSKVKQSLKVDEINGFDYYLEDDATDYYKSLYNELKATLTADEIDYSKYAELVGKMFVADVFNLDNKISSSDVGGTQFIYPDFEDDYLSIAKNGLYSSVLSNIDGKRDQDLPIVEKVEIVSSDENTFNYDGNNFEAYDLEVSISYESDLGYPFDYKVTIIKDGKYLYVAKAE